MSEQAAMQIGGWSDYATMRKIYTHLSTQDINAAANSMSKFYDNFTTDAKNLDLPMLLAITTRVVNFLPRTAQPSFADLWQKKSRHCP